MPGKPRQPWSSHTFVWPRTQGLLNGVPNACVQVIDSGLSATNAGKGARAAGTSARARLTRRNCCGGSSCSTPRSSSLRRPLPSESRRMHPRQVDISCCLGAAEGGERVELLHAHKAAARHLCLLTFQVCIRVGFSNMRMHTHKYGKPEHESSTTAKERRKLRMHGQIKHIHAYKHAYIHTCIRSTYIH